MKKIAVGIVQKENEFLLVRRRQREGNLQWQFPSGQIENAEESSDACTREVYEETDVRCAIEKKLGERIHPDSLVEIHYWLCVYVSGDAIVKDIEELDAIAWCTPTKVKELITSNLYPAISAYFDTVEQ